MKIRLSLLMAVSALGVAATPAIAATETFDTPVVTGPTQAPGVWYTDRYAPDGFTSPVFFDGDNRLLQSIDASDGATSRPGGFSSAFYNTQGRKLDLASGTNFASIDLYVPDEWALTDKRMAGFWATGVDAGSNVASFPILEFATVSNDPRFRYYDSGLGDYVDLGLPTGFAYNSWYTLSFALNGSNVDFSVGDLSSSIDNLGTVEFSNVILQGHNTADGVTYDIYWDNLTTAAVPEPTTWALMIAGFGLVGGSMRRRSSKTKVAFA